MASSIESHQAFVNTFRETMLKSGFIIKNNSFFKVDLENKWVKSVFINLWGQNRLYRICIDLIPFTTMFNFGKINESVYYDINYLKEGAIMHLHTVNQVISFDTLYPSLDNIERSLELYKANIHTEFAKIATFSECVLYRSQLKHRRHIDEFEEYDMIYANLYLEDMKGAYDFACQFRNKLCDQEKRILELFTKYTGSSFGPMQEDVVSNLSTQLNNIKVRLSNIDSILSSMQNHQLELLIKETNNRIKAAIDSCYHFFTKQEQKKLGI